MVGLSSILQIAGIVLETAIKELCIKNQIDLEKKKLTRLNDDLAKAGIYSTLQQKKITALADIRNNAVHGDYEKFNQENVKDMIKDIERFYSHIHHKKFCTI